MTRILPVPTRNSRPGYWARRAETGIAIGLNFPELWNEVERPTNRSDPAPMPRIAMPDAVALHAIFRPPAVGHLGADRP